MKMSIATHTVTAQDSLCVPGVIADTVLWILS